MFYFKNQRVIFINFYLKNWRVITVNFHFKNWRGISINFYFKNQSDIFINMLKIRKVLKKFRKNSIIIPEKSLNLKIEYLIKDNSFFHGIFSIGSII